MFVIVEKVLGIHQDALPDRELANIVHGEYTLLEAINKAEELLAGHHQSGIYIQEVSKAVTPKSRKEYKVTYVMVNDYQSVPFYLLQGVKDSESDSMLEGEIDTAEEEDSPAGSLKTSEKGADE